MSAKQPAKPSVALSPPRDQDSIIGMYNPAASGDGPAAKLWELLRRNPAFRDDVAWMLKHAKQPEARQQIIGFISSNVSDQTSISRPFVGNVLRWLWKPLFLDPKKILRTLFGSGAAKIVEKDLCLPVFGPAMCGYDDAWSDCRQLDSGQFMSKCPVYLLPAQNLFLDENRHFWMRLILPNFLKENYRGPLRSTEGEFNLDTPWPETPRLFRDHFSWLWANYDSNAVNPFTGDRKFLPRPAPVGGFGIYGLQEQRDKLYPRLQNELIFIVPACFHTEQSIKGVCESFKTSLRNEFRSLQVSAKKYQFLLGGPVQWQAFVFVQDRTTNSSPEYRQPLFRINVPYIRLGSGKAIEEFEHVKKKKSEWREGSKFRGHIESRYDTMHKLMMSVYPGDDFQKVVNLFHPGWPEQPEAGHHR